MEHQLVCHVVAGFVANVTSLNFCWKCVVLQGDVSPEKSKLVFILDTLFRKNNMMFGCVWSKPCQQGTPDAPLFGTQERVVRLAELLEAAHPGSFLAARWLLLDATAGRWVSVSKKSFLSAILQVCHGSDPFFSVRVKGMK